MGFVRYYVNRYESREAIIYKLITAVTAIAMCFPFFARYNIKYIAGGCAKDAVFTMMGRFVFPLLELISIIFYMRLACKDINQNVIVRYGNVRRIWMYQSLGGLLFSLEMIVVIYISAIGFGMAYFGNYDKWLSEGSLYYSVATYYKLPLQPAVTAFQMYAVILSLKVLIMDITINIALLADYLSGSVKISILSVIILCGLDWISYAGICGFLDISLTDLYSVKSCIVKIIIGILVNLILFIAGINISPYREFYSKK
jgi:hypothetical protein